MPSSLVNIECVWCVVSSIVSGLSHMLGQEGFPDKDSRTASMKMVLGWLPSGGEVFSR